MYHIEKRIFSFLIAFDVVALIISMIAGPLENETVALASAFSAVIISVALIAYGLYHWRRRGQ